MSREDDVAMVRARQARAPRTRAPARSRDERCALLALSPETAALSAQLRVRQVEKTDRARPRRRAEHIVVDHPVPKDEGADACRGDGAAALLKARTARSSWRCRRPDAFTDRRHRKLRGITPSSATATMAMATNRRFRSEIGHSARAARRATRLAHPRTGARIDLVAPLPDDLREPCAGSACRTRCSTHAS